MKVVHRSTAPLIRKRKRHTTDHPILAFYAKIQPEPNSGCWIWIGSVNGKYPKLWDGRRGYVVFAHRFSWTVFRGDIPDGYDVDHKCRLTVCVNPQHLEPVTRLENLLRGARASRALRRGP